MKTKNKSDNARNQRLLAGVLFLVFSSGCDLNTGITPGSDRSDNGISGDVQITISYDQVTRSYSTLWPEGMVGSVVAKQDGSTHLLNHYENIHEQLTIDENGFMQIDVDWLDGHADVTMPPEIYESTRNIRPVFGQGHNPVVRSVMGNGYIRYLDANGRVLHEFAIDTDLFRVDPDILEQLADEAAGQDTESKIARSVNMLEQQGVNFSLAGDHMAVFSINGGDDPKVAESVFYMDLALGKVTRSADVGHDGLVRNMEFMNYKLAGGMPVMQHSMTLDYGERNGEWVLTSYSVINRDNIRVEIR